MTNSSIRPPSIPNPANEPSSDSMCFSVSSIRPFRAHVDWFAPEPEWHEAAVGLIDTVSPAGRPIVCWEIEDVPGFAGVREPTEVVRIRVARHDGPRHVDLRVTDERGDSWHSLFTSRADAW